MYFLNIDIDICYCTTRQIYNKGELDRELNRKEKGRVTAIVPAARRTLRGKL